jgi:hypothetical protein
MKLSIFLGSVILLLTAPAWTQSEPVEQICPNPKGWKPTENALQQILSGHRQWAEKWKTHMESESWAMSHPEGRASQHKVSC